MNTAQFAAYTDPRDDFSYASANSDAAGMRLSVSVYADRAHMRDQISEDAQGAGFRISEVGDMSRLLDGEARPLGDVILLDCPLVDSEAMAALARLDVRAARAGSHLVVSTSVDGLDAVFGCLDACEPQILVAPSRAERLIALGQVLTKLPARRVRELSEEDRLVLLRLTEQMTQIAERMDRLSPGAVQGAAAPASPAAARDSGVFRFEATAAGAAPSAETAARPARPQLPDPRMVRKIIRQRQMRARFFESDLFADPAWDMLLDLTAAKAENARVSVTSLCIASGVPPTTALRWIGQMTEAGLLQRIEDETDRRRAFITLTEKAADAMAAYFVELGANAAKLV
jgi:hypothetical protein